MRVYIVFLIQLIIWSGFTLIEWLSKHDQFIYNLLMFFVFLYMAMTAGNKIIQSMSTTFLVTLTSLALYTTLHMSYLYLFH